MIILRLLTFIISIGFSLSLCAQDNKVFLLAEQNLQENYLKAWKMRTGYVDFGNKIIYDISNERAVGGVELRLCLLHNLFAQASYTGSVLQESINNFDVGFSFLMPVTGNLDFFPEISLRYSVWDKFTIPGCHNKTDTFSVLGPIIGGRFQWNFYHSLIFHIGCCHRFLQNRKGTEVGCGISISFTPSSDCKYRTLKHYSHD